MVLNSGEVGVVGREDFVPQRVLSHVWNHFWLSQLGAGMLMASGGQRLGISLNILQCLTQHPPHPQQ